MDYDLHVGGKITKLGESFSMLCTGKGTANTLAVIETVEEGIHPPTPPVSLQAWQSLPQTEGKILHLSERRCPESAGASHCFPAFT